MGSRREVSRRRKLPKNITEKTDREIMTRIVGKRVMKKLDEVLQEQDGQGVRNSHT